MCKLLGYSRQAYYACLKEKVYRNFDEELIILLILQVREGLKRAGTDQLMKVLKDDFESLNIKIGRDALIELQSRYGVLIRPKKKRRCITTLSNHPFYKYSNLIKDLTIAYCNHVWVSDITYVWVQGEQRFVYLMLITDVYSRYVVGHHVSEDMTADSIVKGLEIALENTPAEKRKDLIHHSDRGVQYCSSLYTGRLQQAGIKISMTQNGDPLENAIAERVNRTIKDDFTTERELQFDTFKQAESFLSKVVELYNNVRPHSSVSYLTPAVAYQGKHELKRMWKSYYKNKQVNSQET
jgi:transposase InsO family protein